jgi:hypothetical protein
MASFRGFDGDVTIGKIVFGILLAVALVLAVLIELR